MCDRPTSEAAGGLTHSWGPSSRPRSPAVAGSVVPRTGRILKGTPPQPRRASRLTYLAKVEMAIISAKYGQR
jgi:hypothetical protein